MVFSQDWVVQELAKPYKWGTNPDWTFDDEHPPEFWDKLSKSLSIRLKHMCADGSNARRPGRISTLDALNRVELCFGSLTAFNASEIF